jgi:hypothetical protein
MPLMHLWLLAQNACLAIGHYRRWSWRGGWMNRLQPAQGVE